MSRINITPAGVSGFRPARTPTVTGAGVEQQANIQALNQAQRAFTTITKRNGEISALKKTADLQIATENIFNSAVSNSVNDKDNVRINVNNPESLDQNSNGMTFSQHVMNEFDAVVGKIDESTTNPFARRILEQDIARQRTRLEVEALTHETRKTRDLNLELVGETALGYSRILESDPTKFKELNDNILDAINSAGIGGVDAKKQGNRLSNGFAVTTGEAWIQKNADMARAILETGKVGVPVTTADGDFKGFTQSRDAEFVKHLSGDQVRVLKKKADVKIAQNLRESQFGADNVLQSHLESIIDTGKGVPGFDQQYKNTFRNSPGKVSQFDRKVKTAHAFYESRQEMRGLPLNGISGFLSGLVPTPGATDFSDQKDIFEVAAKEAERQFKLAQSDPALLVEEDFSDDFNSLRQSGATDAEISQKRLALQAEKGIASFNRKILTKAETKGHIQAIMKTDGGDQTIDYLRNLRVRFDGAPDSTIGAMGEQVIDEIVSGDGLSPLYRAVANNAVDNIDPNSTSTAFDISRAIKFKGDIDKSLTTDQKTDLRDRVVESMIDWRQAFTSNSPENIKRANEMQESLISLSGMYMQIDGVDIGEAVTKATTNLIDNKLAPDGVFFDNIIQGVVVPLGKGNIRYSAPTIGSHLDWLKETTREDLGNQLGLFVAREQAGLSVEAGMFSGNEDLRTRIANELDLERTIRVSAGFERVPGQEDLFTESFTKEMMLTALNNMMFKSTPDGHSVMLMMPFTHQTLPFLNKDGQPITFELSEINSIVVPKEGR